MPTICKIATARINYARQPNQTVLDVTIKSATGNAQTFAPTWNMVMASKNGSLPWLDYIDQYTDLMRQRYKQHPDHFINFLLKSKTLVLCCYCPDTSQTTRHCHRYILADIFLKVAQHHGIEAEILGELYLH